MLKSFIKFILAFAKRKNAPRREDQWLEIPYDFRSVDWFERSEKAAKSNEK